MNDEKLMKRALLLARRAEGFTEHYPMVGALVVKAGEIISEGFFERPGEPHAEVRAIQKAGANAQGATLVLNLEPCSHYGRTPPCSDLVIRAGIKKVVAGMMDPNPLVSGRGFRKLRGAGIEVISGVLEEECRSLNRHFVKYITTKTPWLILKLAVTADGRIADRNGASRWITGGLARSYGHKLRSKVQVVMVGAGTALMDDPALTVRLKRNRAQPRALVVDESLRIPLSARVLKRSDPGMVIIACTKNADLKKKALLSRLPVELIETKPDQNGLVNLKELMKKLGQRKIASMLCEGGAELAGALLEQGLVDEIAFFYAPKILADEKAQAMTSGKIPRKLSQALPLYQPEIKRIGGDFLLTAFLREV